MDAGRGARIMFNDRLDAGVAAVFVVITIALVAASVREWLAVLSGRKPATTTETPFVETSYEAAAAGANQP